MAKDKYHELVKRSLTKEGWKITDDPLYVDTQRRKVKIDLAAERLIGAEKEGEKIAVEIKSFINLSQVYDFYRALGQNLYYSVALEFAESDRKLFLAIPDDTYYDFFAEPITQEIVRRFSVHLIVYSIEQEKIVEWKK
ncbi:MAG: XisH family protein [Bacteroidota bacterium]